MRLRTLAVLSTVVLSATLVAAACTPPTGPPATTMRFSANKLTVVNHNDSLFYTNRDEPYVLNLWFRVKFNQANSAQVGIMGTRSAAISDMGDGETQALSGAQQASVDFGGIRLLDIGDLLDANNKLEVVGVWTWAMDKDDVDVTSVANNALTFLQSALNQTVATATLPQDANFIVDLLLDNMNTTLGLVAGALFNSIPGIPDDPIGSRIYVGTASFGTLSTIIDAAASSISIPPVAIPIVTVPPDIGGGRIFSLGTNKSWAGEVFDQGQGKYALDLSMVNTATLPKPPTAAFTSSATSGTPPLSVSFDSSPSGDLDGTIVARNWNFGDYTTGAGTTVNHTFATAGQFPVTLTVTDNDGQSNSSTTWISVGGAPTVAPTGLQKTGAGCCDTYADFAWNTVPGATSYEISMDGYFGGGCLTDHGAVISGQVSTGRVTAVGLCLGSSYNVSIRAQANGLWGPWSPSINVTL